MKSFFGSRVFISGPMTDMPFNNAPAFAEAHARLKELGAVDIYDPALNWLTSVGEVDAKLCMRKCLLDLLQSRWDCILLLDGWEDSEGSALERSVAEACGIPCVLADEIWPQEQG